METLRSASPMGVVVRAEIVVLTIATGWIHLTLGGMLFTLNGLGYLVAAVAMIAPLALAIRFRWLVRLGLIGYALAAIVGWYLTGPRYDIAYVAKAIEVGLIALLLVEVLAYDGNPLRRIRRFGHHASPLAGA
jgi:hypothetical protein